MKRSWEMENMGVKSRHPNEARSKFEAWILAHGGSAFIAQAIGVHQVTVCNWMRRGSVPNAILANKLLKFSEGTLSLDDIVDGTSSAYRLRG